jgi:hypothetical protein
MALPPKSAAKVIDSSPWFKIRNPSYSEMAGREELFERERHGTRGGLAFMRVSVRQAGRSELIMNHEPATIAAQMIRVAGGHQIGHT